MADTNFFDGTVIEPSWLNDVNDVTYTTVPTNTAAITAISTNLADTSNVAYGDALIGVKVTATGGVATTQHEVNERALNVFDFLTEAERTSVKARNHAADVTAGVLAAIAAAGANKTLIWPAGSYKITATLALTTSRTQWVGAGRYATQLYFAPTAADTCVEFGQTGATVTLSSIRGIGFYSDDSTYKKIGIDIIDTSNCGLIDVGINGSVVSGAATFWSGASSVGLRVRGKELCAVRDLFIAADLPIQISTNPSSTITIDHFNFHNLYLLANANPHVTIDTGVNLTQVSFTGYQSWVLGTSGIKWTDTTSSAVSNGLLLENIRCEQGTDDTQYLIDISHNSGLQGLVVRGGQGGGDRRTAKLRKVENVTFDTYYHTGTYEALNVDSTVKRIELRNCFWQAGASATMTGQRLTWGSPLNPSTAPLPSSAVYDVDTNTLRTAAVGGPLMEPSFTVASGGTQDIGGTAMQGMLFVCDSEGYSAIFLLSGTNHTTAEVSDPAGIFSITSGTASMTNVYWNAGTSAYRLQNNRPASRTYRLHLIGSYIAIT